MYFCWVTKKKVSFSPQWFRDFKYDINGYVMAIITQVYKIELVLTSINQTSCSRLYLERWKRWWHWFCSMSSCLDRVARFRVARSKIQFFQFFRKTFWKFLISEPTFAVENKKTKKTKKNLGQSDYRFPRYSFEKIKKCRKWRVFGLYFVVIFTVQSISSN